MTQQDKFLAWCKENNIKFAMRPSGDGVCYNINPDREATIVVQGVALKMNPMQECNSIDIYFRDGGRWAGGTNTIWNTDLPWYGDSK